MSPFPNTHRTLNSIPNTNSKEQIKTRENKPCDSVVNILYLLKVLVVSYRFNALLRNQEISKTLTKLQGFFQTHF